MGLISEGDTQVKLDIETRGNVPVLINGQKVPTELYTKQQFEQVQGALSVRKAMNMEGDNEKLKEPEVFAKEATEEVALSAEGSVQVPKTDEMSVPQARKLESQNRATAIRAKDEAIQNTIPDVVSPASPEVETDKPLTGNGKESENPPKENAGDGRTVYGEDGSPTPGANKKSVPILSLGFEYSTELSAARKKVLAQAVKGNLDSLSSAQVSCSVQLGIDESLWAIDEGTYMQENIYAYYFGDSISALKIKIVGNDCNLITDL